MSRGLNDWNSMYDFVVRDGNGIKGLVDMGLSNVPDPYMQPTEELIENQKNALEFDYPPIDFSKLDGPHHDQVVQEIVGYTKTFGVFQAVNHGMSLELLESLKVAAHKFHGLPPETKAANRPTVVYQSSFLPEKELAWEWRDILGMGYTNDADALAYWPIECRYPALEYMKLSIGIVRKILKVLINKLGAKTNDSMLDLLTGSSSVSMNFYPPCPNPELTAGLGRHSDLSIITVLLQDNIGGLYVKLDKDIDGKKKGDWMKIPPIPGALVIIAGDFLEVISNGKYKSVEHRVRTTRVGPRVSIPCFVSPTRTIIVGPLPEAVEKDGGPRYGEFVCGDYMKHYLSIAHQGKKPLDFACIEAVDSKLNPKTYWKGSKSKGNRSNRSNRLVNRMI